MNKVEEVSYNKTSISSNLMICNYISALPRCQQEESVTAQRASRSESGSGLVARQTQQKLQLEVGKIGYLASHYTSQAPVTTTSIILFNMVMVLLLTLTGSNTNIYL